MRVDQERLALGGDLRRVVCVFAVATGELGILLLATSLGTAAQSGGPGALPIATHPIPQVLRDQSAPLVFVASEVPLDVSPFKQRQGRGPALRVPKSVGRREPKS